jgi:sodium/proline symporter
MSAAFFLYLLAMVAIGAAGYRATRNLADFILGGRRLGRVVTALSAGASDMSGWLLMGLPGAVFASGLGAAWMIPGLLLGAALNWVLVARRLREDTARCGDALTLPDYFCHKFGDPNYRLRALMTLVILVFFTLYCASGMVAGARLFERVFELPYTPALWLGAAATVSYVFLGGFLAVSWTDTLQAILMVLALVLVPAVAIWVLHASPAVSNAGWSSLWPEAQANPLAGASLAGVISLMGWGLGYFGQPHILVRFMAIAKPGGVAAAARLNLGWMALCLGGAATVGFLGIPLATLDPGLARELANPELVFIALARTLFPPWLAGVLLAGVLAAVMSTLSCQLLLAATTLTEDLYRRLFRPTAPQRELVWMGRMMVLAVAVCALALARDPEARVLGMVSYAWAGFGAAFGPVLLLALWWPRLTRAGVLAGMGVGALTVVVWKEGAWWGLYELVPAFFAGTVAAVLASLFTSRPETSPLVLSPSADAAVPPQ